MILKVIMAVFPLNTIFFETLCIYSALLSLYSREGDAGVEVGGDVVDEVPHEDHDHGRAAVQRQRHAHLRHAAARYMLHVLHVTRDRQGVILTGPTTLWLCPR